MIKGCIWVIEYSIGYMNKKYFDSIERSSFSLPSTLWHLLFTAGESTEIYSFEDPTRSYNFSKITLDKFKEIAGAYFNSHDDVMPTWKDIVLFLDEHIDKLNNRHCLFIR